MSSMKGQNSKKPNIQKALLRTLAKKSAVAVPELTAKIAANDSPFNKDPKDRYAITRSLKGLREAGLVEQIMSSRTEFARLTKEGRKRVHSLELEKENQLLAISWDGMWRIILLDLPEERKSERESLRYLLKKAGFVCLKNSAWISPFPYEHLFANIKKDLGLSGEMMIIVTSNLDEESRKVLFETFGKSN
jgi:DNA-binding transcriptional regulator PaaX